MSRWTQRPKRARRATVPNPDPGTPLAAGEETVLWAFANFATGIAPPVRGRRWFRDADGRDIEPLLEQQAGWPHRDGPAGPPGVPPQDWRDTAAKAAGAGIKAAELAVGIAAELAGGSSAGIGNTAAGPVKKYMDPAIESDDFPVMIAAPGSVAASAPWQLDPSRRPADFQVLMSLTSQRLLLTCIQTPNRAWSLDGLMHDLPREFVWEVQRQHIARAEQRRYSEREADAFLCFTDGSRIRLAFESGGTVKKLQAALNAP